MSFKNYYFSGASRINDAGKIAAVHLVFSLILAAILAALIFFVWYPFPYIFLSGGLILFSILIAVDLVCGPLLTLILFSSKKRRAELAVDLTLVIVIQLAALCYGVYSVYQARPLFLVHEVDRFKVVGLPDYGGANVDSEIASLPHEIRPSRFRGPIVVGTHIPSLSESRDIFFESLNGGRDYAERPEFYVTYDELYKSQVLKRAKALRNFIDIYPENTSRALSMLLASNVMVENAFVLPVQHRQDWVAVLDNSARIIGFLPGDGFAVL